MAPTQNWQELAKAKRESILAAIPKQYIIPDLPSAEQQRDVTGANFIHKHLTPHEIEITETDAVGIVAKTTTGAWTAVEVTKAFIHRASIAHQLVSCLHEIAFADALATAEALDAHFAQHKAPLGPLHGLPVSLKDQFHVRGLETTMGYVGWIGTFQGTPNTGKERVFESVMVAQLRALGAVIYCKTSVPHTLMVGETVNNIIGYTHSPRNRLLSAGGSSGGEGALIAAGGSPVGFGTDIGGSIRIPAAFNGIYGIRPSTGRLPYEGMANSMDGQNSVLSVVGPLATSVPALRLLLKSVLSAQPWFADPLVHELPWRDEQERAVLESVGKADRKLAFGVLRDDGVVAVTPPVRRALEIVVATVKKLGHEVIEWNPPSHEAILDCCTKTWIYDGGTDVISAFALSGEPQAPHVALPTSPRPQFDASAIAANNILQRSLQKSYLDYWNSTAAQTSTGRPVDTIIAPVAPFPAARPQMYRYYGYSMWVNLLDYTSVVIPVTSVDPGVDVVDAAFEARSELDGETQGTYDPEIYKGAPVAVQLVGRRLQEEKMLAVAEMVDAALKGGAAGARL